MMATNTPFVRIPFEYTDEGIRTLRVKALVGDLLPKTAASLLVCANVAVLGGELALKEPCTKLGAKLSGIERKNVINSERST